MAHGKEVEATQVLACLEAKEVDDAYVITQREEIVHSVRYEREHAVRWRDLFVSGKTNQNDSQHGTKPLRRLLLGAGTQFMQQFGGINIMSYYLPTVLIQSVGLSEELSRLLAACNATSYLFFSFIAVPVVERYGRRFLMILASVGQGFSFLVITILLSFAGSSESGRAAASASVAFFFLYYIFFGIGMQGVPWLYPTEINSLPMRTKGAAVATATNWISNFVIVEVTPIGIQNLGWRFWIVWTIFNFAFVPLIYFLYPETSNRTLEDMDDYYRSNPPLVVSGDKDMIKAARPQKYIERENEEMAQVRRRGNAADGSKDSTEVEHVEEILNMLDCCQPVLRVEKSK